jgi:DnaJ family protein C protein 25
MMRYNQEAYYKKYGSDVMFTFAPKTDTLLVIIFVLLIVNGFVYFAQYNKWHKVCSRLSKAAVEDWNPSQGGTYESKELRDHAIQLMEETKKVIIDNNDSKGGDGAGVEKEKMNSKEIKNEKKKNKSTSTKEKKEKLNDELRPIIEKLAYDIVDFGAGYHKPTWMDLVMIKLIIFPYHFAIGTVWQLKYWIRRIQKIDLSEEEKKVLTERSVGNIIWEYATENDKTVMIKRELWLLKNLKEWNEEREFAKLSKTEQKQYKAMMKREKQN